MLVSYGSKKSKFHDSTDHTDSNHLTHANVFLLFVFSCQFSVCVYTCVLVCMGVCLFFHTIIFFQDKPVHAVSASQQ